jgi:hypothetical protein
MPRPLARPSATVKSFEVTYTSEIQISEFDFLIKTGKKAYKGSVGVKGDKVDTLKQTPRRLP